MAGHKIEAMTARRTQPDIFETPLASGPVFSARLPINLGNMMIPRAMATITRISDMIHYQPNLKMGIITSWAERVL